MEKKEYTDQLMLDFGEDGSSLIPAVAQDYTTKEVLIQAFVNREAFEESLNSGYVTFWSRSRQKLWKKGETSGDLLKIEEMRINCEQNSLVFLVTPLGKGACHAQKENGAPYTSCYYRKVKADRSLEWIERS